MDDFDEKMACLVWEKHRVAAFSDVLTLTGKINLEQALIHAAYCMGGRK
jgi:hypothetical protein